MPFMNKAERWCAQCRKTFVAAVFHERVGRELGPAQETTCPDCGGPGTILAEVPRGIAQPVAR